MKKVLAAGLLMLLTALLLCGCGPKNDETDPLSGYGVNGVDVLLPFATSQPGTTMSVPMAISTPSVSTVTGWLNEIVAITEGEYAQLEQGSIGTKVKNLQKRLIELGYMSGTASGTFDYATTQAVKLFESAYGQKQTGVASELMQTYLFSNAAKVYTGTLAPTATPIASQNGYRTLQRGDSGDDVSRLKQRLSALGYLSNSGGNYYDVYTENAVRAFESAYNKTQTGVATIALQQFLFSTSAMSVQEAQAAQPVPTPTPAPWSMFKELKKGSKGNEVTNLQNRLRALGYMTSKADGIYGEKTVDAIKAFEAAYGREQTGVATQLLQYYLYSDDALMAGAQAVTPEPVLTYSLLSYGDYGDAVAMLQERLIQLGYLKDTADGYYGKKTQDAVSAFETGNGHVATGVATAALQQYLYSASAKPFTGSAPSETYTQLVSGDYGAGVSSLQQRLKELGYYSASVTGYFDSATVSAVKLFESAYGITETGIATVNMQQALYSDGAKLNPALNTAASYTRLQKGDKGENVAKLQKRLIELGYLSGTVDGNFGEGTESAVKAFENAYGKTQTGIATAALQVYLFSDTALKNSSANVAVSYSTLAKGSTGNEVKKLQARLIDLGYMSGSPNGTYDNSTVNAVKAFQKACGLTQTGTATAAVQRELFSSDAKEIGEDEVITNVNKLAYVSVAATNVYGSTSATSPIAIITIGTEVKILRKRGIWAEIQSANGNVGYALYENFSFAAPGDTQSGGAIETVNKQAIVNVEKTIVFANASTSSQMLGTLTQGAYVTWLRTRGEWAEIQNSAGKVGYVQANQLLALSSMDEPTGTDVGNTLTHYETLKYNNTGSEVKKLQTRLKALGYFDGDIGGNYLDKTTAAVKEFEAAIGLSPTGIATAGLQDIMFSAAAPKKGSSVASAQYTFTDLNYGDKGEAVGTLQLQLVALGFLDTSAATYATYDEATAFAVMDLQSAMGLQNVDGMATRELQAFVLSYAAAAVRR